MCNSIRKIAIVFLPLIFLGGCTSTPHHTNTLIFAVNTKLALDVSAAPMGGIPGVTIGYSRQEAVWMPLLANRETKSPFKPAECNTMAITDCHFRGKYTQTLKTGETEGETAGETVEDEKTDAYSVLASFGAKLSTKASSTGGAQSTTGDAATGDSSTDSATGFALAQFFATGIAAQNLATEGGARLVTIQPTDAETTIALNKAAEAEGRLKALLGEKAYKEITEKHKKLSRSLKEKADAIIAAITNSDDDTLKTDKWITLVESSSIDDHTKAFLKKDEVLDLNVVSGYLLNEAALGRSDDIDALYSKL